MMTHRCAPHHPHGPKSTVTGPDLELTRDIDLYTKPLWDCCLQPTLPEPKALITHNVHMT